MMIMEDARQSILLRAKRASVVLATALVLLECGWILCGGILRLIGGSNPYLPNLPGFSGAGVLLLICCSVLLASGQILFLTGRSRAAGVIVGGFFLFIGLASIALSLLSLLLPGHDDGDGNSLTEIIVIQSTIASWLFIGTANILGRKSLTL
jgi:hypothetical protein